MLESRTHKSLLNAKINFIFYALTLILTFFSRKIFFDCLGAEFLGFTTTLQNLLGFLNLAELGLGTAIAYVLYKPLFNADREKINEIISVLGYLYRCIGLFILISGITLSFFLLNIFPGTGFSTLTIYGVYYTYMVSSLIGYFINYRQNLLSADQRNYVVAGYFQSCNIVKILFQMTVAYYTRSYYLWIGIEFSFGIIYSFILNWKINKTYPWLKSNLKQGRALLKKYPEVTRITKQIFFHKLGSIALGQITPLLTYAFTNLTIVALFSNYTVITSKLSSLFNAFMDGTNAGVGNLIAEGNIPKSLRIFWELTSIRYFVGSILSFCIFLLAQPFISLWLGKEYILDKNILFLVCISKFIGYSRGSIEQFLNGFGLYWDIWAPVVELIINIGVACLCGFHWGLPGVLLGGIVSQLLIVKLWKPCLLFYFGFKKSVWIYFFKLSIMYFALVVPMVMTYYLIDHNISIDPTTSYLNWVLYALIACILYSILATFTMASFIPNFRYFFSRVYNLIVHTKV